MAITLIGVGTESYVVATANASPTLHASTADNDLIFGQIFTRNLGAPTTPGGWTTVGTNTGASSRQRVIGQIAASAVAPSIANTDGTGASGNICGAVLATFRGTLTDMATVQDDVIQSGFSGSAQDLTVPALTVLTDGCLVIAALQKNDDWTSVPSTFVDANAGTFNLLHSSTTTTGGDGSMALYYQIQTTKKNVTGGTVTVTGGAASGTRGIIVAFKPSGGAVTAAPAPGVGALSYSGLAPTLVGLQRTAAPGVGALQVLGLTIANSIPGVLSPGVSPLSISGLAPTIQISAGPQVSLSPAALSLVGLIPNLIGTAAFASKTITPSLVTSLGDSSDLPPTILMQWTTKPAQAQLTLAGTLIGNLISDGSSRITPGVGALTINGQVVVAAVPFDGNLFPSKAALDFMGQVPDLVLNTILTPDIESLSLSGLTLTRIRGRLAWHDSVGPEVATWHVA